ncbi:hypothetical protein NQ314_001167 [Rhamnusium bicolor]|uniref:Uncharacterized protein n=1 Tax=Rhamnusium bicolor TaxID=1586634 RepID=A0AAV8ZUZ7_9CUCU|nr:hypothetical protein NQ314_001167 [Rhamnusium bicolor]
MIRGIGLFSKFLTIIREQIAPHLEVKYIETSLYSVEIVFFILGSFWVYKEYQPKYNPTAGDKYCEKTVYLFAFVYLTVLYAIAVAILSGFMCFLICIIFLKATDDDEPIDAESQTENVGNTENRPQATV